MVRNRRSETGSILTHRHADTIEVELTPLTIARALLKKPTILILDDSTSAVDMQTEAFIKRALKTLLAYCTTFVVIQRINTVLGADQILFIKDGEIVEQGTHQGLLETG